MKKILVIFIVLLSSNVLAHMDHYKKYNKIEMDIFRNGELIGYNYYFFTRKGHETIVTNQIKFSVKILGVIIFQVEGYGEENYLKDQLVSYNSKTFQNEKEKFVNLRYDKKDSFLIVLFSCIVYLLVNGCIDLTINIYNIQGMFIFFSILFNLLFLNYSKKLC